MTIIGFILMVLGAASAFLIMSNAVASLTPYLEKMPLGIVGYLIVAAAGVVLMIMNRRPAD
jgi:hypothetical protein